MKNCPMYSKNFNFCRVEQRWKKVLHIPIASTFEKSNQLPFYMAAIASNCKVRFDTGTGPMNATQGISSKKTKGNCKG